MHTNPSWKGALQTGLIRTLSFRVDGKHFEYGAFRKRCRHENFVISLLGFQHFTGIDQIFQNNPETQERGLLGVNIQSIDHHCFSFLFVWTFINSPRWMPKIKQSRSQRLSPDKSGKRPWAWGWKLRWLFKRRLCLFPFRKQVMQFFNNRCHNWSLSLA